MLKAKRRRMLTTDMLMILLKIFQFLNDFTIIVITPTCEPKSW